MVNRNLPGACARVAGALAVLVMIAGCDDDARRSSETVDTGDIYAAMEIYKSESDRVVAEVQLTLEGPPSDDTDDVFITLGNDDQLWFSSGDSSEDVDLGDDLFSGLVAFGDTHELLTEPNDGDDFFLSVFNPSARKYRGNIAYVDGTVLRISLIREDETDALNSEAALPQPFVLNGPEDTAVLSRNGDTIALRWEPTAESVQTGARVTVVCTFEGVETSEWFDFELEGDPGQLDIDAGTLVRDDLTGDCETRARVVRTLTGSLDEHFTGGYIRASQVRTLTFTTTD